MLKKKYAFAAVALFSFFLLAGCNTAKGVATGVKATAKGAVKDVKGVGGGVKKADSWVKKNLW